MLEDIVEKVVESLRAKPRWIPPSVTLDDIRQEAWVAVLESQESGINDPSEILRLARLRVKNVLRSELHRKEVPFDWIPE